MKELIQNIKVFNENTKEFFQSIKAIHHYLTNPKALGILLWNSAAEYSFYVCLTICLTGVILYLIGYEKGSKLAKTSFFGYLAIQIFNSLI